MADNKQDRTTIDLKMQTVKTLLTIARDNRTRQANKFASEYGEDHIATKALTDEIHKIDMAIANLTPAA